MSTRRILLAVALATFLIQTGLVLFGMGYRGFFEAVNLNAATRLMFLDVVITLTLIAVWMREDAAASGRIVVPYILLTLLLGSAGPLLYLLKRAPGARRSATAGR